MMIWKIVYAEVILIYAIATMAMLLDIHPTALEKRKRLLLYMAIPAVVVYSAFAAVALTNHFPLLYPLLIHLPLLITFSIATGRGVAKSFFVLLTAIFLSYPPGLTYSLIEQWSDFSGGPQMLAVLVCCGLMLYGIHKTLVPDFTYIMDTFTSVQTLALCTVPIGYNILVYLLGGYSAQSSLSLLRFVLFLSSLGVYYLLINITRITRHMRQLQSEKELLNLQTTAAQRQLEQLRSMSEQSAVYRHDMRHHLAILAGYLENGEDQQAKQYIMSATGDIERITPHRYCENNSIDLILSFFAEQAMRKGVAFRAEADVPATLNLPETELCAFLSNGIENALHATSACSGDREKLVFVKCRVHKGNLLILVRNPYEGELIMDNGLPRSSHPEHGLGVKSIALIAEKHNGIVTFDGIDSVFTFKAMIPLHSQ